MGECRRGCRALNAAPGGAVGAVALHTFLTCARRLRRRAGVVRFPERRVRFRYGQRCNQAPRATGSGDRPDRRGARPGCRIRRGGVGRLRERAGLGTCGAARHPVPRADREASGVGRRSPVLGGAQSADESSRPVAGGRGGGRHRAAGRPGSGSRHTVGPDPSAGAGAVRHVDHRSGRVSGLRPGHRPAAATDRSHRRRLRPGPGLPGGRLSPDRRPHGLAAGHGGAGGTLRRPGDPRRTPRNVGASAARCRPSGGDGPGRGAARPDSRGRARLRDRTEQGLPHHSERHPGPAPARRRRSGEHRHQRARADGVRDRRRPDRALGADGLRGPQGVRPGRAGAGDRRTGRAGQAAPGTRSRIRQAADGDGGTARGRCGGRGAVAVVAVAPAGSKHTDPGARDDTYPRAYSRAVQAVQTRAGGTEQAPIPLRGKRFPWSGPFLQQRNRSRQPIRFPSPSPNGVPDAPSPARAPHPAQAPPPRGRPAGRAAAGDGAADRRSREPGVAGF